jgi:hypothetical protein
MAAPTVPLDSLRFIGRGLHRPECVLATVRGDLAPDGSQEIVLEDCDPAHVDACEAAYLGGTMGGPHLDRAAGRLLKNISSLAFGGPGLRTAYLGCLLGDSIAAFESPVAGHPPAHWNWR